MTQKQQAEKSAHIIRVIHDAENPFVMLNKRTIRDPNLSLEAVGLWARLLCNKDDWTIHVTQLMKANKCGRDKMYRILKELVSNGYAYHVCERLDGRYQKGVWYVFETVKTEEEIKKMFPFTEKPYTGKPNTANPQLMKNILNEEHKNKEKEDASAQALDAGNSFIKNLKTLRKEKRPQHNVYYQAEPEELTNNVKEPKANNKNEYRSLALSFHSRLKQHNPKIKSIDIEKWGKELSLLSKDGEGSSVQEIEKVIEYVISTHNKPSANGFCWANIILSPNSLRKNFSRIWAEMNSKNCFTISEKDNEKLAKNIYKKLEPNLGLSIQIGPGYLEFVNGMRSEIIPFSSKDFREKVSCELLKRKIYDELDDLGSTASNADQKQKPIPKKAKEKH